MPDLSSLEEWLNKLRDQAAQAAKPPEPPPPPPPPMAPPEPPSRAARSPSMWEELFDLPAGTLSSEPAVPDAPPVRSVPTPARRPTPRDLEPPPPMVEDLATPPPTLRAALPEPEPERPAPSCGDGAPRSALALSRDLFNDLRRRPQALREAVLLLEALGPCMADRDPAERFF